MKMKQQVTFRPVTVDDGLQVAQWIRNDPDHQTADERLFTEPALGRAQFAVEVAGKPAFYVSVENVARVHIQFDPSTTGAARNLKALYFGFAWLRERLKERGYLELIFDSRVPRLVRFCQSVLGFIKRDQDYSVRF